MNDYKVGDKVRVVNHVLAAEKSLGRTGVIVKLIPTLYTEPSCTVQLTNGTSDDMYLSDIELVEAGYRPKRSEWLPKAVQLHAKGLRSKAIAEELGVPARTVRHNLQQLKEQAKQGIPEPVEAVKHDAAFEGTGLPTIFVIGDTQCKQGIALDYLHWVGAYIARKKPDIIVQIGDHYDMASLSSYDKGKLSAEGRRVQADIDAGDKGLEIIQSYIDAVPNYTPRKVVTLGNHEERIDRFVQDNPAFEGYFGTDKLAFTRLGWEVYPFLTAVNICGINFVHFVQNVNNGKPLGGTVSTRLKNVGESFVMGHQQILDTTLRYLPLSGRSQIGIVVGACYEHQEGYKGVQGNHHFRGCVMLYECKDGYAMHKAISLEHMKREFEARGFIAGN